MNLGIMRIIPDTSSMCFRIITTSHTQDIVWQVKWAKDNLDGYLNFYSVSGDGRVTNWTIVKTALWFTDTLNITFSKIQL